MMAEKMMTVKEVAWWISVSERAVQNWLQAGRIKGCKIGRKWFTTKKDVEDFMVPSWIPELPSKKLMPCNL